MGPEALAQVLRPLTDLFPAGSRPEILAGFPASLPPDLVVEVFRGGGEKAREAGCAVVGGHTITSPEPMFGMAVVGFVDPGRTVMKSGAMPGDALVLANPIGAGVVTTALKRGTASAAAVAAALDSMKRLNRDAARLLRAHDAHCGTDVTGFSLLGHALELARRGTAGLRLGAAVVPLLPGTLEAAGAGSFPGGTKRDQAAFAASVDFGPEVDEAHRAVFFCPETSGSLLAAVPSARAEACLAALRAAGVTAATVGRVDPSVPAGRIAVD